MSTAVRRLLASSRPGAMRLLTAVVILTSLVSPIVAAPRVARAASAVTTIALNLRSGPGLDRRIKLVMPAGVTVEIIDGPKRGFYKVVYNGVRGWAHGDYLNFSGSSGNTSGNSGPGGAGSGSATVLTGLNLRAGPSTADAILAVMPAGTMVSLTGDSANGFLGVIYNGQRGWAYGSYLGTGSGAVEASPPPPSPPGGSGGGTATVTTALNLRAGPSSADAILAVMPAGTTVELTGDSANGFLGVIYNGRRGWAYGSYLTSGGNAATPPPVSNPAPQPPSGSGGSTATVSVALNLRAGPSTSHTVIAVMPVGAKVELTGDSANGFLGVIYNSQRGWAYGSYLSTSGGANSGNAASTGNWIIDLIYAAADHYGQSREDMLRVARCESLLDPKAFNPRSSASGLFQFLPGTWATTPYASYDIFDPWANAMAAGWMWSVGRRNEWVCQ